LQEEGGEYNGFSCWVSFEEEMSMPDLKLRSFFSKWGDESVLESAASSEVLECMALN